jgi:signal transduction histidine kinase
MIAPSEVLRMAAKNHAMRTATHVGTNIGELPNQLSLPLKLCLYRFAQECLMNAYVHAGGIDQKLVANYSNGTLTVEVSDGSPGLSNDSSESNRPRLGLAFMRDRVESLGGSFEIVPRASRGVRARVRFNVNVGVLEGEHN